MQHSTKKGNGNAITAKTEIYPIIMKILIL
jgi:hypothetical protein